MWFLQDLVQNNTAAQYTELHTVQIHNGVRRLQKLTVNTHRHCRCARVLFIVLVLLFQVSVQRLHKCCYSKIQTPVPHTHHIYSSNGLHQYRFFHTSYGKIQSLTFWLQRYACTDSPPTAGKTLNVQDIIHKFWSCSSISGQYFPSLHVSLFFSNLHSVLRSVSQSSCSRTNFTVQTVRYWGGNYGGDCKRMVSFAEVYQTFIHQQGAAFSSVRKCNLC